MSARKPLPRRKSSTARIALGGTWSAAFWRKNSVSETLSGSVSRNSRARSSRPVASGTRRVSRREDVDCRGVGGRIRDELLGADGVVALAPAEGRVLEDLRPQLEDAVDERLRPGRATGDVHVDRHELVGRDDRVVVEDAHRARAGAHRERELRLEHLVVDAPDDRRHLDADAPRQDDHVGLAGGCAERLEAEAPDVHARPDHAHHLDRAAGEAEREREHRVAPRPRDRLVERRREDALLDVLLELLALQLAAQHVARPHLADAEVVGDLLAPDYLHSSAPLRQTYTRATSSSAMKTTVSISANDPNARNWIATG